MRLVSIRVKAAQWLVVAATASSLACAGEMSQQTGNDGPCRESSAAVPHDLVLPETGFAASAVLALVQPGRRAPLTWPDGNVTEVTFEVGRVTPFLVSSRHNPEYPNPIAVDCKDHVAINASVTVATADGRLAETWSSGELFAADGQRLRFSGVIPAGRVEGSYRPTAVSGRTFSGLSIESTLTAAEFSGQLIEMFVGAGAAIAQRAVSW